MIDFFMSYRFGEARRASSPGFIWAGAALINAAAPPAAANAELIAARLETPDDVGKSELGFMANGGTI